MSTLFEAETLRVEADDSGIALLRFDVPGRPYNLITPRLLTDLDAALDRLAGETSLRVLALRSSKPTGFLAGADIQEFTKVQTPHEAKAFVRRGQELFSKLELLPLPTLAIVHGPCLGGGLELALACDYRLVIDTPGTQIGLPEIELGLLPAWGGCQRLPRVVGLENALQVILNRKRLNAREAYEWGLADALARGEAEQRVKLDALIQRAREEGKQRRTGVPLRSWREKLLESTSLGRGLIFRATRRLLERRVWDDFTAPFEALEAIRTGLSQGMEAGLAREREAAGRLALSPASRNLVYLFFRQERARKLPAEWKDSSAPPIERVGVVGAGVMGAGIAQLALLRGCQVVVQEVNADALGRGVLQITNLLQKARDRGVVTEEQQVKAFHNLKGTTTWEGFDRVEVVVEAAVEDLELKRKLFRELAERTPAGTILATNTSSLLVADLQEGLAAPERLAGLHFFNPVHKLPLIEVVRGAATAEATLRRLTEWALKLGKTPIQVKDSPGFVVNRVLMPYVNEAVVLVAEGLGIEEVDRTMEKFGMPMGPLEMLDQVGLDTAAHIADSMRPRLGERFAPNPTFRRLSESGWLGVKTGLGFYSHRGRKPRVNKDVLPLVRADAPDRPALRGLPATVRVAQARERMVLLMVNEAAACLAEGLAASAEQIDLAMVLGTGWAPHRGGPLRYADERGLKAVVEALEGFVALGLGRQFEPHAELRRRAADGELFYAGEKLPGASAN